MRSLGTTFAAGSFGTSRGNRSLVRGRRGRAAFWALALVASALLFVFAGRQLGYDYEDGAVVARSLPREDPGAPPDPKLSRNVEKARTRLASLQPKQAYVVVDATNNRLYLRKGGELIRTAICSSGSGYVLQEGPTGRTWVFDSPQGEFRVQTKLVDPVWRKPDWAFVEASEPIPKDPGKRLEYGVLGRYALYFGNGFMIHGTLYERLLGRSVTHGCIRLGKDDLAAVYEACPIGTRIYIY